MRDGAPSVRRRAGAVTRREAILSRMLMPMADVDVKAPDREPDVLGRLLLALQRETDLRGVLGSLDFWPALGGGYVLEWFEGPYADEVRDHLVTQLVEGESLLLGPEDFVVRTDIEHYDMQHRLFLLIRGVRVEFRSCNPVGLDQAREKNWMLFRQEFGPPGT